MTPQARVAAAIAILDRILDGGSAERTLTTWARQSRFAGSGDRAAIRDLVFDALRRRRSYAWLGGAESGRGLMIGRLLAAGEDLHAVFTGAGYAPAMLAEGEDLGRDLDAAPDPVKYDCQDWLWPELNASLGADTVPVLTRMQSRAPVFLRTNLRRITRADAIASLASDGIEARPHALSPTAIEVVGNPRRVQSSTAFKMGEVELQDAASQAITDALLAACPTATVLDYCAGGGGKSLALAAGGAGTVTAHDIDPGRMKDLPLRAERAGVEIAITASPKGLFDTVLCDAPCSGSGAWRRQPEAKWTLTPEALDHLTASQDGILDRARTHVAPGGCLAYATCSLLDRENGDRAEAFLDRHPEWSETTRKRLTPLDGGDGFFIAVFRRF